jgi:hypothetical protein
MNRYSAPLGDAAHEEEPAFLECLPQDASLPPPPHRCFSAQELRAHRITAEASSKHGVLQQTLERNL